MVSTRMVNLLDQKEKASTMMSNVIVHLQKLRRCHRMKMRKAFESAERHSKSQLDVFAAAAKMDAGEDELKLGAIAAIQQSKPHYDRLRSGVREIELRICSSKGLEVSSSAEFDLIVGLRPKFAKNRIKVSISKGLTAAAEDGIELDASNAGYEFVNGSVYVYKAV